VALAQLLHCINTAGHQVTVHRDIVVRFLIIHATELLPVMTKSTVIPHVTSLTPERDSLHANAERSCLIREMRGMMGVGVKQSTATVAQKKRIAI
jgi:hypothetical protein